MKDPYTVPSDVDSAWQETLRLVENTVGTPTFEACLRDAQPVGLDHDVLKIAVPGPFSREWLSNKSRESVASHISQTLEMLTGRTYQLEFVSHRGKTEPASPLPIVPPAPIVPPPPRRGETNGHSAPLSRDSRESRNNGWEGAENRVGQIISANDANDTFSDKFTFDTFVVGSGNQLAYAAALSVAENPGRSCNPLFLYGGVGLGKTHLMMAIGNSVLKYRKAQKVVYVSCETFTNELIDAVRDQLMHKFRKKYRGVDLLLVDDIQFLMSKERTQEEFFYTFNELYNNHRQVVLTSDRPPNDLHPLQDRLRSRFASGLIADIQTPDLETREAILRKKAELDGIEVPHEIISFIAERFTSNIRELEGAMLRVYFFANIHKAPITIALTMEALKHMLPDVKPKAPTVRSIQERVCQHFRIKMEDLTGERRDQKFALPRQIAMFMIREMTGATFNRRSKPTSKTCVRYCRTSARYR
ncbi:MAG: chromosomal replication initiator protein DnaA [Candidatus Xenobia bacterium]